MQPVLSVKKRRLLCSLQAGFDYEMNHSAGIPMRVDFCGSYSITDMADNCKTNTPGSYYILDMSHLNTASIYVGILFLVR
jgi:hypothetical protein